nr:hypothetical protein [Candidatus Ruthia endofausta]
MEYLSSEDEAKRDDKNYSFVAAWDQQKGAKLHEEHLHFEFIKLSIRNYK